MIKGVGFGKYLKQLLFILLISCFGFLGSSFVNAGVVYPVGTFQPSIYDSNYENQVIRKGSFLTQVLGTTKNVFSLSPNNFFIWSNSGYLYSHMIWKYGTFYEGYLDGYYSCDEFAGGVSSPQNCSFFSVDSSTPELYSNFLKTVNSSDYFYYDFYTAGSPSVLQCVVLSLCISSRTLGKSLCWFPGIGETTECQFFGSNGFRPISLSNSEGLGDISFGRLNGFPSPAVDGSIDGGDSSAVIGTLGGNQNYIQCTLSTALDWYKYKGYSERLCYGGLDDFGIYDTAIPIYGQGLTVTDVFSGTRSLRAQGHSGSDFTKSNWFGYWRNLYKGYKNGMYNNNPFSNVPTVLFTYFGAVDVYGGAFDNDSILEFCKISLHDGDLTALYSGVNSSSVCNWSPLSIINDTVNNEMSSSGYISVGSSWDGILSGTTTYVDGKTFISDYFNKLKENFVLPDENNPGFLGVLPGYIIIAMLGLILFRFLSH